MWNTSLEVKNQFVAHTAIEWFEIRGIEITDDYFDDDEKYNKLQIVNEIITLQISYYLLRRLSFSCQSLSDNAWSMIKRAKRKYEETYGEDYPDPNENVNW